MNESPSRRRCSCNRYLVPLANGTAPRHTLPDRSRSCPAKGRVFPAVARQRALSRSLSAVQDGFSAAAKRMNDRARQRSLQDA